MVKFEDTSPPHDGFKGMTPKDFLEVSETYNSQVISLLVLIKAHAQYMIREKGNMHLCDIRDAIDPLIGLLMSSNENMQYAQHRLKEADEDILYFTPKSDGKT